MINQNEIFAALQRGESPDAISQNFADALNAALKQHRNLVSEKRDRLQELVNLALDFMEDFYPDLYAPELREFDVDKLVNAMNESYKDVLVFMNPVVKDDPIRDFLKKHGL